MNNQYPHFDNSYPLNNINFYRTSSNIPTSNLRVNDFPTFKNPAMFGIQNMFGRN